LNGDQKAEAHKTKHPIMLATIATTIYEMVEDSQRMDFTSTTFTSTSTSTNHHHNRHNRGPTTAAPLDHLVIARLASSVLLHRDYNSALFQRTTWCRDDVVLRQPHRKLCKPTPAVHFAQSNSFLDRGDHLEQSPGHPLNQPRQCNGDTLDTWDNLNFLYSMFIHAVENMNEEECDTWLNCLEQDSCAFDQNNLEEQSHSDGSRHYEDNDDNNDSDDNDDKTVERRDTQRTRAYSDNRSGQRCNTSSNNKYQRQRTPLAPLLRMLVGIVVDSEMSAERVAAKNVLHALFDRTRFGIEPMLRTMVCSEIVALATGEVAHGGVVDDRDMLHASDLLDILFKIVSTFPTPLHPRHHRPVLMRVMVALHRSPGFPCVVSDVIPTVLHLLKKGGVELTLRYLRKIINLWPRASPRSERAFLTEMFDLLQHVDSERRGGGVNGNKSAREMKMLSECTRVIFESIAHGLRSSHFEVSIHASRSFSENHAVRIVLTGIDRKTILPIVVDALLDNRNYWHDGVSSRCRDLMEAFTAMDRQLVRRLVRAHRSYNGGTQNVRSGALVVNDDHSASASGDESVSSEMYASSEYSSSSYTSSDYTNSSDSPRVPRVKEESSTQSKRCSQNQSQSKKNKKKTSNKKSGKSKHRTLPIPPTTPERRPMPPTPPLSPSFVVLKTVDVADSPSPPGKINSVNSVNSVKSLKWRMPTRTKRTQPKWTTHDGKKKRLAWGSGLDGSKVLSKKEGSVLARAKRKQSE
jgi:hypothetical protein